MIYFIIGIILLAILAALAANTRTAQLKRMAHTLNLRYDKQIDGVLLPDSTAKAQFFKHGLHQFYHALTFREPGAFLRVCEDRIFSSPLDKKPLYTYTLVAAELFKDTFPPFVLAPRTQDQAPTPNLPPELSTRYTLSAPEGFVLPPVVIGFLKAHPACYIECTPTALLYCEFNIVSVAALQPLRFRALQLLKELVNKTEPIPLSVPATAPTANLTDQELQAQLLLKLQKTPHTASPAAVTGGRYIYGFVLLAVLGAMLFMAWYILHHGIAH